MNMKDNSSNMLVSDSVVDDVKDIDAIIFDCDGVLVDITESYDTAINKTVSYILNDVLDVKAENIVTPEILYGFKSKGGFNDEVAVCYAVIFTSFAARELKKPFTELIKDVIENSDERGVLSVDDFLQSIDVKISNMKEKLNYSNPHETSYIYTVFDQIFYGSKLYEKIYKKSAILSEDGLIEQDKVIFNSEILSALQKKFEKKIAVVTGRGRFAFSYSLKKFLENFDLSNSIFLEDESKELAKPNVEPLIKSIKGLNSKCCIYVGDSMEDMLMANKATQIGFKTIFCGIYGTSKKPQVKLEMFKANNVPIILESIEQLPKALNLV
tara:strand:- start:2977 stop:3954 length:978 start_codon:yes stop_codon:yes gene_type:complete